MPDTVKFRSAYLIGAVIVWVAIILASSAILAGTPYLTRILLILGGGVFWFIVLVPAVIFRNRQESDRASS